jgi:hypothetical protein
MMYFYKKTDKAIICTTETLATKSVKLPNGNVIQSRVQVDRLKFGVLAVGDQEVGELKVGDKLPFNITDSQVMDQEGNPTTLYWCTPE